MTAKDWNLKMVQAEEALAHLPTNPATGNINWGEIDVAHIDTGCTYHPVFGFDAANKSEFVQLEDGVNHLEPGNLPIDPLDYTGFPGHGTRTGSVLCGNLPGTHMGVAPGLPTIPYRAVKSVLLASKKSRNRVGASINHAVNHNGCEVISISLGYPMMSIFSKRRLGLAVDNAYENGVIVAAAGGQVIDRVTYPGKFSRTIGVGGIRPDAKVWHQYDVGESVIRTIDIWAPGDDIHRANSMLQNGQTVPAEYKHGDGTSGRYCLIGTAYAG